MDDKQKSLGKGQRKAMNLLKALEAQGMKYKDAATDRRD